MLRDESQFGGGDGSNGPWCPACKQAVAAEQASVRLEFDNDPHGYRGLTGQYHLACSKPFASIAQALKMMGRLRG